MGYACIGWVEDHYADGTLKHRGYYDDGRLIIYRKPLPGRHPGAGVQVLTTCAALMRTYHANGTLLSEAKGTTMAGWFLHGPLCERAVCGTRRKRQQDRTVLPEDEPLRTGWDPISTFEPEDKKRLQFRLGVNSTWDGTARSEGLVAYHPDADGQSADRYLAVRPGRQRDRGGGLWTARHGHAANSISRTPTEEAPPLARVVRRTPYWTLMRSV